MKLFSSKKRAGTVAAVAALTLVGGGVAYGYWTTTGGGSGTAATADGASSLLITGNAADEMYPGDSVQDLDVSVQNNAVNSAYVTGLTAVVTTSDALCDGSNYLINGNEADVPVGLTWTAGEIASGVTVVSENTIQFNNKTTEQDDCKGVDVFLTYASN